MAFYVYAWRDVRDADQGNAVTGTKDAPRVESTIKHFVVEKATAPAAADLLKPLQDVFTDIHLDATLWTTLATDAAAANANATVRANETTTVDGMRWGKQYLQFGCGYHGTDEAAAFAAINWKNL